SIYTTSGRAARQFQQEIQAVSVVGSSPIAQRVYATAANHGKRVQALGGAKNSLIVMPDAELEPTVESIIASAYGCAGQRCLAGANVVAVGEVADPLRDRLRAAADALKLGNGLDPQTTLGPVITAEARHRVIQYIELGLREGATLLRDGRADCVPELPNGYFIGPTLFDDVAFEMRIAQEEIFGPLLNIIRVPDLSTAIEQTNRSPFGNSASIYTTSGRAARQFQQEIQAGMLGINLGVPAPMAFFPFSGWKMSFFGDLHAQGRDGIEFYTRRKVVTSRWFAPREGGST
ncbi:MAG: aldehyde dehydrogenase family protein, partial [Planctomycetes bacterium]|nr:aldehyde dehydrogenase family protein [Planctomycetota bacterium]